MPLSFAQIADALYPEPEKALEPVLPDAVRALRDTPEGKLYDSALAYRPGAWDGMLEGLPADTRTATIDEVHRISADLGASQQDLDQILIESKALAKAPPTPEARAEMQGEAARQLVAVYGKDAKAALDDAKALVARDPRLAKLLDATGLGDSPKAIMTLAALANGQRARGRLK